MYVDRLDEVRLLLKRHKCSYIFISDSVDIQYICGFRSSNAFLLVGKKEAILFTDFRYREAAEAFIQHDFRWRFELITESTFSFLSTFVPKGSVIGVQSESLTVDSFDQLQQACESCRFTKLSDVIPSLSLRKSGDEIRSMKKAVKAGENALADLLKQLRYGLTELQAAQILEDLCREYGSEKPSFDTIMLFGSRSALPHGTPSGRKLRPGDFVLIDFGCTVDGFCSDMTRTFIAGEASKKQKEIYRIVANAQKLGVRGVKPGIKTSDVDRIVRSYIEEQGYGEAFGHATGHGVGRRIHENPRVSKKDETTLEEGMVITIEPGIYLPSVGGVRIEDMVLVTETGSKSLHTFSHALKELPCS